MLGTDHSSSVDQGKTIFHAFAYFDRKLYQDAIIFHPGYLPSVLKAEA